MHSPSGRHSVLEPCDPSSRLDSQRAFQRRAAAVFGLTLGAVLGMLVFSIYPQREAWATAFSSLSSRIFGSEYGGLEPAQIHSLVIEASRHYNLEPEFVWAVVSVESNFKHNARSRKGAQGYMQLMPATAFHVGVSDINDPKQNVYGGVRYLRTLFDRYKGNHRLTLAAYNAGPGAVKRFKGCPPYPETKRYVGRVMKAYLAEREKRFRKIG